MDKQETTAIAQGAKAHENYNRIIQCQANIGANSFVMAALLTENREEGYYKFLDYDTFEAFLGSPEIGFKRSKAFELMRLYDIYVKKLGITERDWVTIGTTNLSLIARKAANPSEWIEKARSLSNSDLMKELGGPEVPTNKALSPLATPAPPGVMSAKDYVKLVKKSKCLGCGTSEDVQAAHFPRTRVRGKEHQVIPLCGFCHAIFHKDPKDWTWKNRTFWGDWLFGLFVKDNE